MVQIMPTPVKTARLGLLALVATLVLIGSIAVLGFVSDPFGWKQKKIEKQASTIEQKSDDLSARKFEGEGAKVTAQRVDIFVRDQRKSAAALEAANTEARSAPDASQPLPAERADRLRSDDERLCQLRPTICAARAAAAPGHPADGSRSVRPLRAASRPDGG